MARSDQSSTPSAPTSASTSGPTAGIRTYHGGCHCGAVRFQVDLDLSAGGSRCNCSICSKIPNLTTVVPPAAFAVTAGADALGEYAWGGKTGTRYFCTRCGVHCFLRGSLPQLGGAYVSVTLNCLDEVDPSTLAVVHWDGRHDNWQAGPRPTPWPINA
jgi:hypothetical protein